MWRDEMKGAVRSGAELAALLGRDIAEVPYPVIVPRPLLERIAASGEGSALWRQFVPDGRERGQGGFGDPIGDRLKSPLPQIVHRYKNRLLLMPTPVCPVACRYCFRKNELSPTDALFRPNLEEALAYIASRPEVDEVILSGGDPLVLDEEKLDYLFGRLARMEHVKDLRIHTRMPVVVPGRVFGEFLLLVGRYAPRFRFFHIVIHANHASEIDKEVASALGALVSTPAAVLSQSVLLRGVNDCTEDLVALVHALLECGVRPYYLHHPDEVKGGGHFCVGREEGLVIYRSLKRELPGWAVPKYVIDSPEGTGKREVGDSHTEGSCPSELYVRRARG